MLRVRFQRVIFFWNIKFIFGDAISHIVRTYTYIHFRSSFDDLLNHSKLKYQCMLDKTLGIMVSPYAEYRKTSGITNEYCRTWSIIEEKKNLKKILNFSGFGSSCASKKKNGHFPKIRTSKKHNICTLPTANVDVLR